jgi:isoleucyl-tRNA synthetase
MIQNPKRYTITAALPYTNGPIHIGHLAGVYVPADIYSRYLRLQGKDVAFICGSDEHGVAISMKAKKKELRHKKLLINTTESSVNRLQISEFRLIIIPELRQKFIMIRLQNSLENCMIKAILLKKLPSNYTMQKQISF